MTTHSQPHQITRSEPDGPSQLAVDDRSAASSPPEPPAKLAYSVPEAAYLLSISRASAYEYVRAGIIRSVSLGGRILVPRTELDRILSTGDQS